METPAEELLKKIHELEAGHARLKQEMTKLMPRDGAGSRSDRARSHSVSPQRSRVPSGRGLDKAGLAGRRGLAPAQLGNASRLQRESRSSGAADGGGNAAQEAPAGVGLSDRQYLKVLQSMGQSVHIFNLNGRIIYWNRSAEHLYGYSASEALGQDVTKLTVDSHDFDVASNIFHRVTMGESWTGKFPVKNKLGDHFLVVATNTPFYDDDGSLVGVICVSSDSRSYQEAPSPIGSAKFSWSNSFNRARIGLSGKGGSESQQPLQVAIASKISNLATKVTNKVRSRTPAHATPSIPPQRYQPLTNPPRIGVSEMRPESEVSEMDKDSDPLLPEKEIVPGSSGDTSDPETDSLSAACCRICLEHDSEDGDELIAPCMCKGTQQFVHRSCLDHWRAVKEGFAFSHCTTCKAQFHLRVEFLEDYSWRKTKFRLFVARDVLLVFLAVQTTIATIAGFAYLLDQNGSFRNSFTDGWDRVLSKHPIPFYYCLGVVVFFVLLGFVGLVLHCSSFSNNDPCMAGCRNCCYGWGILDCFPASMEACLALIVIFVVVFAILGIAYGFLAATMAIQRIWQRHYHILTKRELTKEYVVEDLGGCYTPPKLDQEHEERLKSLKLL